VLAIQDITTVRAEDKGRCIALHPEIAIDAIEGALLGLVNARFFSRTGGKAAQPKTRPSPKRKVGAGSTMPNAPPCSNSCASVTARPGTRSRTPSTRTNKRALEAVSASLEGKTARQKNPHAKGSLAFAAGVFARLGGWTGYYGKPGPVVMLHGLVQLDTKKCVNPVGSGPGVIRSSGESGEMIAAMSRSSKRSSCRAPPSAGALSEGARAAAQGCVCAA
jgi:hypothetical protein